MTADLRSFENDFQSLIGDAADSIGDSARSADTRRASVMWKTRMVTDVENSISSAPPAVALIEVWTLCERQYDFLSRGPGKDLFGVSQPTALQAAQNALQTIEVLAGKYLPEEEMQKIRQQVRQYAEAHPLAGEFRDSEPVPLRLNRPMLAGVLGVVGAPLAPLMTAQRINEGVGTIREWAPAIDRLTDVIQDFPRQTRWQAEHLLATLDRDESVQSALASADRFSQSTDRLTRQIQELQPLLQRYADIMTTLPKDTGDQARDLLADLDRNRTTQSATQSLDRISLTSEKLAVIVQALPASIQQAVDQSSRAAKGEGVGLVDHIFWRAVQLLILGTLLGFFLILLGKAGSRRRGSGEGPETPGRRR